MKLSLDLRYHTTRPHWRSGDEKSVAHSSDAPTSPARWAPSGNIFALVAFFCPGCALLVVLVFILSTALRHPFYEERRAKSLPLASDCSSKCLVEFYSPIFSAERRDGARSSQVDCSFILSDVKALSLSLPFARNAARL